MNNWKKYKWPLFTIVVTILVLILLLTVGYSLGILSENPDGLEKVLETEGVSEPESFWTPILSWIENNYIAGILGIVIIFSLIALFFYLNAYHTKKRKI